MPEKRNQHFVPQFLLRNFSSDGKTIKTFYIAEDKTINENSSIKKQCSKNYFYSKNLKIEESLGLIETHFNRIIQEYIIKKNCLPNKRSKDNKELEDCKIFCAYILSQSLRTVSAVNDTNKITNSLAKELLKLDNKYKKNPTITEENINSITIESDSFALENLRNAYSSFPLIYDLESTLLMNCTNVGFFISDHPVILYNKSYKGEIGLVSKGLIILMPITPKYYIILYDSTLYETSPKNKQKILTISKQNDIDGLNLLQSINANKTIYYLEESEEYLKKINKGAKKHRNHIKEPITLKLHDKIVPCKNGFVDMIDLSKNSSKFNLQMSYLKSIDRNKIDKQYLSSERIERDPFLANCVRNFNELVDENEYKLDEFHLYYEKCREML